MAENQMERSAQNVGEDVYADVYRVLLAGMLLSSSLFGVGVVLALLHPAYVPLTASWIQQHYHWHVFLRGLLAGDAGTFMMLGTILLILTPVVRVLVSIYVFYVDHDYKYVAVTGVVFLVMALTALLSCFGLK